MYSKECTMCAVAGHGVAGTARSTVAEGICGWLARRAVAYHCCTYGTVLDWTPASEIASGELPWAQGGVGSGSAPQPVLSRGSQHTKCRTRPSTAFLYSPTVTYDAADVCSKTCQWCMFVVLHILRMPPVDDE